MRLQQVDRGFETDTAVYFPHPELAYSFMTLVVRTDNDPGAIAPAVQKEIRALDPNQPVSDVRTMNQVMSEWVGRLAAGLLSACTTRDADRSVTGAEIRIGAGFVGLNL